MAFPRATGKHRRPGRLTRKGAGVVGVAALATTGVVGTLAAPALAADGVTVEKTALNEAASMDVAVVQHIAAQAGAQEEAADRAAAKAAAEKKAAAEAKRKAEAERKAEERAKKERAAKERSAREAERKRLNAYTAPVGGSYVSTGYQTGGALWSSGSHSGVDFHAASGTSVMSVGPGTVVEAGDGGAYGNQIVIRMSDGTYTQYGHLSSIGVSVGQSVTPGQQVGLSGATGNVTGPHLHFEARTGPDYGSDIDPVAYLRSHGVDA